MTALTNEQIGQNVALLRETSGMSMDDLASAMRSRGHKWTRITVFNVEHGERMLKVQEAVDLLDSLGISTDSGMRIITSENEGTRRVRAQIRRLHEGLDDLRDSIVKIQNSRVMLRAFLPADDDDDSSSSEENEESSYGIQLMFETEEACDKLHVAELLQYTDPDEILRVVRDLLSFPPVKWITEKGRATRIMYGSPEKPLKLRVASVDVLSEYDLTGEPYRVDDSDENDAEA